MRRMAAVVGVVLAVTAGLGAQRRPASPEGTAATQIGGRWIEVTYGRPILRGRTSVFGAGADYGVRLNDGAPVWRAGANVSTRLNTEAPLRIGGTRVAPGEYVMLIDLKGERDWTFILTTQPYALSFDPQNKTELFGAYNYQPTRDVVRVPMRVDAAPYSVDQLTWGFTDVTGAGGDLRIWWERTTAAVAFLVEP